MCTYSKLVRQQNIFSSEVMVTVNAAVPLNLFMFFAFMRRNFALLHICAIQAM